MIDVLKYTFFMYVYAQNKKYNKTYMSSKKVEHRNIQQKRILHEDYFLFFLNLQRNYVI